MGLAPLQEVLAQQWQEGVPEVAHTNGNGNHVLSLCEPAPTDQGTQESKLRTENLEAEISLSHLLSTLNAFEEQLPQCQETARSRLLTKALCQELELLQRQQTKNCKA